MCRREASYLGDLLIQICKPQILHSSNPSHLEVGASESKNLLLLESWESLCLNNHSHFSREGGRRGALVFLRSDAWSATSLKKHWCLGALEQKNLSQNAEANSPPILKQGGFFQSTFLGASSSLHSPPSANTIYMISWNWVNTPRLGHRIQEDFSMSWVSWREVQLKRSLAFSPVYCSVWLGPWPFRFICSDSPSPCIPICVCTVNTGSSL